MRLVADMPNARDRRSAGCFAALLALLPMLAAGQQDESQPDGETGLELVNLSILDSRDGYAIPADSRFLPGEPVHVYFQVSGYGVGEADRVSLRYEVRALDPDGRRFFMAEAGNVDVTLAPQDKDWLPVVRYSPRIPDHAGGGTYAISIEVHDEIGEASVTASLPIEVDGDRIQTAGELLVRNFRFVVSEDGETIPDPVFAPGDCIRAEFYITGYKTRDDNTFQVESDAWVTDSLGRRMFQFEARGEAGSPYYPRLWLPGSLEFELDPAIPAGEYTVVLRLVDAVGGSGASQSFRFRIR